NSAKTVSALEFVSNLYTKQRATPTSDETKQNLPNGRTQDLFDGRIGMSVGIRSTITQIPPDRQPDMGMVSLPMGPGGRVTRDGPQAYGVGKGSKAEDAVWKFVIYMSSEPALEIFLSEQGTLPVRKSTATSTLWTKSLLPFEKAEVYEDAVAKSRAIQPPLKLTDIDKEFGAVWNDIIAGK